MRHWMTFIVAVTLGLSGLLAGSGELLFFLIGIAGFGLGGLLLGRRDDIIREEERR